MTLSVGHPAPALMGVRWLRGPAVTEWTPGQIYVIDFWAPWCAPCHAAIPGLARLQQDYPDRLRVIGVAIMPKFGMTPVERFVSRKPNMTYAVAKDVEGTVERGFWRPLKPRSFPGAVVVDGNGKIAWIGNPHPGADQTELRRIVSELVKNGR